MRIRYSYILVFILTVFPVAFGQQVKSDQPTEAARQEVEKTDAGLGNLKKQVTEMYAAMNKPGDAGKLADFAHPKLIEIAGSREKYIALMKKMFEMSNNTFETFTWTIGTPNALVKIDEQLFGVVPRTLTGVSFQKNNFVQEGATVGISADNGKTWKFVNGPNFKSLFPAYADKVQIPEQINFVNGIKQ